MSSIATARSAKKRVVLTMGGKGGVGKTGVAVAIAEWYRRHSVPHTLLDLDTENKGEGSLNHFFPEARKVNIADPTGLDAFINQLLDHDADLLLADMGAGAGAVTAEWFDKMYPDIADLGIAFTAVGVVTHDAASVVSVLAWAERLRDRVDYLIVINQTTPYKDFGYWDSEQAQAFREQVRPRVVEMEYRVPAIESPARTYGLTLGRVARRDCQHVPELMASAARIRAQGYIRRLEQQFDRVGDLLIP